MQPQPTISATTLSSAGRIIKFDKTHDPWAAIILHETQQYAILAIASLKLALPLMTIS